MFLTTSTLASSGEPFSLMYTLKSAVHVLWIFFCFFRCQDFLAISALCFVRRSLMKTLVLLSFLPCFRSAVLCFLLTNLIMIAGISLSFLPGRGWHALMLLQSISIPLSCRKAATCCSTELASKSVCSPTLSTLTARAYERGFTWRPVTITSFILVYGSRSSTLLSRYASLLSFSVFCIRRAFTSSTSSRILFCCNLTAEISSDKKSRDFFISFYLPPIVRQLEHCSNTTHDQKKQQKHKI